MNTDDPASRATDWKRALTAITRGEHAAAEEILPLVYDELRALARAQMAREAPGRTIQATALVHEAYLRLVGNSDPGWDSKRHFFAAAATAMRRILVEQARSRSRAKRSPPAGAEATAPSRVAAPDDHADESILDVHTALEELETKDPRKGELVALRYFVGLSNEEIAAALGVSIGTVERDWRLARAWLQRSLGHSDPL